MDEKELRIGNWIINFIDEEFQVNGETFAQFNIHVFKPIPLTEQWLEDLGCTWTGVSHSTYPSQGYVKEYNLPDTNWDISGIGNGNFDIDFNLDCEFDCFPSLPEIKYVHQLQNLYFALTEKELIKQ